MIKTIRKIFSGKTRSKRSSFEDNLYRNLQYKRNHIRFNADIYGIKKTTIDDLERKIMEELDYKK